MDNEQKPKETPQNTMPSPLDEKRKQDIHDQQLQFNNDKHTLDLDKLKLQLQQAQETFQGKQQAEQGKQQHEQMKQQQEMAKNDAQNQEQQAVQQQQQEMMQQQQQAQGLQYQQNIMAKAAAMYSDELEPWDPASAAPAALIGTAGGGAAAHFMAPASASQHYRDLAAQISPEQTKASWMEAKRIKGLSGDAKTEALKAFQKPVKDISQAGNKMSFKAPDHVAKRYLKNRALQSNAKRLAAGSGLGLLAGLGAYSAMKD